MQYDLWWWTNILLCKYLFVIVCGETILKKIEFESEPYDKSWMTNRKECDCTTDETSAVICDRYSLYGYYPLSLSLWYIGIIDISF